MSFLTLISGLFVPKVNLLFFKIPSDKIYDFLEVTQSLWRPLGGKGQFVVNSCMEAVFSPVRGKKRVYFVRCTMSCAKAWQNKHRSKD